MYRNFFLTLLFIIFSSVLSLSDELYNKLKIINPSVPSELISFAALTDKLSDYRLIYIGENHDAYIHHKIQLEIIKALYERDSKIAIGMEMFQNRFQNEIDSYINGHIYESEFLAHIDYIKNWGFNFEMYKPILEFAKEHKLRVIGLNAEPEIIGNVSDNGIARLEAKILNQLPSSMDFGNKDYRGYLMHIYEEHPRTHSSNFNRFYEVQLVWDESMAERINDFINDNNNSRLVVLTGNGHLVYGYGIPSRVYRRNGISHLNILLDVDINRGISDYIITTTDK